MELNNSNQKNSGLKAAIAVLALLLCGSGAYIYKIQSDKSDVEANLSKTLTEKDKLVVDLEAKIAEYDKAISENTALKSELEAEQAKMMDLLEKVKKAEGNGASLSKYKNEFLRLKREMDNLVVENNKLKEVNTKLQKGLDSTNVVVTETRKEVDTLKARNTSLSSTVERGQKLSILNLQTLAVKQRSSGKQLNTDKASRADVLKISFSIAENHIAKTGDRKYYIQVIDSKGNVLGSKKLETMGDNYLSYSFEKVIRYENKTVQVQEDLPVKNIEKGTYFVNVFDEKGTSLTKSSFSLR